MKVTVYSATFSSRWGTETDVFATREERNEAIWSWYFEVCNDAHMDPLDEPEGSLRDDTGGAEAIIRLNEANYHLEVSVEEADHVLTLPSCTGHGHPYPPFPQGEPQ